MKSAPWYAPLLQTRPMTRKTETGSVSLTRSMGLFRLTTLGIGSTIGTGIFVVMTQAVPVAGPAVILSFIIAGITATLTALCYAELASMMPESGSSYSYTYASLGELPAFVVAWCLLLEYGVSTATVAVGWSEYLNKLFMTLFGWQLPKYLSTPTMTGADFGSLQIGLQFNLPAVVLVLLCVVLLLRGTRESATTNAIMVVIKIAILAMFIGIALFGFHAENLHPFAPGGMSGVRAAAGIIFFSYIGIDAISTAGEEVKNPGRTLPMAIILALVIVTGVYILTAVAAVGAQPSGLFKGQEAGLAVILANLTGANWPVVVFTVGAIISIFSVTLVTLYGQTRILYVMSRDGMLPQAFNKLSPRARTPVMNTILVGILVSIMAAIFPLDILADLVSLGTLVAFAVVSLCVIVMRSKYPDVPRPFKVPFSPVFPILSIAACIYVASDLAGMTYLMFGAWLIIAALVYVFYSYRHSVLRNPAAELISEAPDLTHSGH